ncbi:thioredoxin family protein [Flavobacterium muglaense]|uniref:Thioredoxin family protein n=1 Tax=Flavobacterium muglaense TaxID=2764716 RepID=A0A923N206_9FLAO|nr:thioredoxin family protein [Flavobacterium muglaense]MBC5839389.1 thioredoxin family protein [Flavobacterium muglaense]MBC5845901.1 thioredoxin family protein [Flavobacterium muglaense]
MSNTLSNMIALGTKAPEFYLRDMKSGSESLSYADVKGEKGTLVLFICNHCPFVLHVITEIVMIANDYRVQGLGIVAISSNDIVKYPQDAPALMTEFAFENNFEFPYLYDESQEVAKAYEAACTPDFYLFDSQDQLVYRGQLDDSRPGNGISLSGSDLRGAIDGVLYNRSINPNQKPSIGCNIKWK